MPKFLKFHLPVLLWAALIFLFSSFSHPYQILPAAWRIFRPLPTLTDSSLTEFIGVVMHFLEFAILSALILRAITQNQKITRKQILLSILLSILYALSDEIHQLFVPERTFQLQDLLVDLLGTLTGVFLFHKRHNKNQTSSPTPTPS